MLRLLSIPKLAWPQGLLLTAPLPLLFYLQHAVPRTEAAWLLGILGILMAWYGYMWFTRKKIPFQWIIIAGIAYRLTGIGAFPALSDDVYRFVWDGQIWLHGEHPFARKPSDIPPDTYTELGLTQEMYTGLNSPEYFTIYPPLSQAVFAISTWLGRGALVPSATWMQVFMLLCEVLSMWLLSQLLARWRMPQHLLIGYAFHPLVIVELVGNIHMEAGMVTCILAALWLWDRDKWVPAALALAGGVLFKLLPILFLPLLIAPLGWRRAIATGFIVTFALVGSFLIFSQPEAVFHIRESLALYVDTFEFHASVYYLLKLTGIPHDILGPLLSFCAMLGILGFAWVHRREKGIAHVATAMLWALSIYFLSARIVHPWYISTLVGLAVLGPWRFPWVWAMLLPLTYLTYRTIPYEQPMGIMLGIYVVVLGWVAWEIVQQNKKGHHNRQGAAAVDNRQE